MRLVSVFLIAAFSFGCGADPANRAQAPRLGMALSPPSIATLVPSSVPVNSAPFTMTINGTNFGADAIVLWNGLPQHTTVVSSTQLLVAVTSVDLMFTGLTHVFVRTGGMSTNTLDFDVAPQ